MALGQIRAGQTTCPRSACQIQHRSVSGDDIGAEQRFYAGTSRGPRVPWRLAGPCASPLTAVILAVVAPAALDAELRTESCTPGDGSNGPAYGCDRAYR